MHFLDILFGAGQGRPMVGLMPSIGIGTQALELARICLCAYVLALCTRACAPPANQKPDSVCRSKYQQVFHLAHRLSSIGLLVRAKQLGGRLSVVRRSL